MAEERADKRSEEKEKFALEAMTHLDHLYRVAFHLVKEENEAKDFVQETYVRALGSYERFTPGTNMKAWMTRILYNFFFDFHHQRKRWVSVEDRASGGEQGKDYWEKVPSDNPGPEDHVAHQELSVKINEALGKIPEEFRLPIVLVDMGEFSYAETAEILSCPVGTVRSRIFRGRRLLHTRLKGYAGSLEKGQEKR